MSPDTLWSRINICAREESGQALEYAAVFALWLEYQKDRTKLEKDRNMGLQLIRAMTATQILAMSKKDRRSDELFHLILSAEDGHTTSQELLDALRQNAGAPIPDVASDMHVGWQNQKRRGYLHFVEEGSKTANMTKEYEKWRTRWGEIMKEWALKHPEWKP
jgi:hypothetical protein